MNRHKVSRHTSRQVADVIPPQHLRSAPCGQFKGFTGCECRRIFLLTRANRNADRTSCSILDESFEAAPSTPSPTGTRASSIRRNGITPLPKRMLLVGQ